MNVLNSMRFFRFKLGEGELLFICTVCLMLLCEFCVLGEELLVIFAIFCACFLFQVFHSTVFFSVCFLYLGTEEHEHPKIKLT